LERWILQLLQPKCDKEPRPLRDAQPQQNGGSPQRQFHFLLSQTPATVVASTKPKSNSNPFIAPIRLLQHGHTLPWVELREELAEGVKSSIMS
jgi:hypothetical protein